MQALRPADPASRQRRAALRPRQPPYCLPTHVAIPHPPRGAVLTQYDYVFAENGLVAYKEGQKLAVQSLVGHLGEKPLQVGRGRGGGGWGGGRGVRQGREKGDEGGGGGARSRCMCDGGGRGGEKANGGCGGGRGGEKANGDA